MLKHTLDGVSIPTLLDGVARLIVALDGSSLMTIRSLQTPMIFDEQCIFQRFPTHLHDLSIHISGLLVY
ncbi:hypothetical protein L2E82_33547 [Cichorium intybus]|uniref:Uncharacterized protein n=1 Tax=Cichorium intybus TaxID=13427 RepID=A0ACB9BKG7_CICIN|nr:hypothetical protein L2E82_33547 [Cichorium intybus]